MKAYLANAAYGVLDYAAYPIGMLLVAPVVLRNLGASQYGLWVVVTAAVSMGSIIASGFGDANIQHVANLRGSGQHDALLRTVRSMIGINLVLGTALALIAWALVPYAARHLASSDPELQRECLWSLRIAAVLMWVRTQESVCISTQRAFERYGSAVQISILARLFSLVAAAVLACFGQKVIAIAATTALINLLGTGLQFTHLRQLIHAGFLVPAFDRDAMKALVAFGAFSWLQAISGVIFSQADRLFLGVSLGAVAVASYALCTQMAQPISGFSASGLHFIFPYLAGHRGSRSAAALRKSVLAALTANVAFVAVSTAALLLFGQRILHAWAGDSIAQSSVYIFPVIVWSSALLGLNVTATYSLLAFGRFQIVTWFNLTGGALMLLLMVWLLPRFGTYGLATARLCYGAVTLLLYVPLALQLRKMRDSDEFTSPLIPACEEA